LIDEEPYTFNAYYEQRGNDIVIDGEGFDVKGIFDGQRLILTD
jgi:hypothetical protein